MKSPFYFIIKPFKHNRYVNSKVIGGEELIISTSDEDHRFSNRYGEVVSTPLGYRERLVREIFYWFTIMFLSIIMT